MKMWGSLSFMMALYQLGWASEANADQIYPTKFIIIGAILLIIVIFILYNRQKRRFND